MAYGAKYPQDLASLVIEDMDIRLRSVPQCSSADLEARRCVSTSRVFPSFTALEESLRRWYEEPRINRWQEDGRVFLCPERGQGQGEVQDQDQGGGQEDTVSSTSSWWCGVNPLAQYHAKKSVLARVGEDEWEACGDSGRYLFTIHVFVAGSMSACSSDNVRKMKELVPRAQIHSFPSAEHSIHRTDCENYVSTINEMVIPDAAQYYISRQ